MHRIVVLVIVALLAAGCTIPRDPDGSFDEARDGGALRVGVAQAPPWASSGDPGSEPSGVEVDLVRGFAKEHGLEVEWVRGAEGALLEALEQGGLDVVAAGLTTASPWTRRVATTRPYLTSEVVVAALGRSGDPSAELDRVRVAYPADDPVIGALLRKRGAEPIAVDDVAAAGTDLAALPDWSAETIGLVTSDTSLQRRRHVLAVERGENRLLGELERYIEGHRADALRSLSTKERP